MALNIGDRVGPYELLEEIGSGGMGVVFRARELESGRVVAVKTLAASSSVRAARLRHEASFLSVLAHRAVMPFIASGESKTRDGDVLPWFAMALQESMTLAVFRDRLFDWAHDGKTESGRWTPIPGRVLARRAANNTELTLAATQLPIVARGRLPEIEEIIGELCEALAHVHANGIVHCDLAPTNIFLQGLRPILADFDIARRVDAQSLISHGGSYAPVGAGTSHYMSPEQFTGAPIDARSDIYSLGCLLFELLTGRPPFTGSPATIREGHLYRAARPPSELVRELPPRLDELVKRMLAKEPRERPPFANDVRASLAPQLRQHAKMGSDANSYNPGYLYTPRFTGRPLLVGKLVSRLSAAQRGQGSLVLVRGESKSGKSRLLSAVCEGQAVMTIELRSDPIDTQGQPKHWMHTLAPLFDLAASIILTEVDGPLARWIARRGAQVAAYSASVAELIRGDAHTVVDEVLTTATVELMQALAGDRGLVLVVDDLHLHSSQTVQCLAQATSQGEAHARPLVLASAPTQWSTTDERSDSVLIIDLQPLESLDLAMICADALADDELPPKFVAKFVANSQGYPGLLLELLNDALTTNAIKRQGPAGWSLADTTS